LSRWRRGSVDARALLTVQVPAAATYRISAAGRPVQQGVVISPRIVLGEPTGAKILRLVGAGVVALLAFIGLCILLPGLGGRLRA
jgi:hypothetical protein